MLCSSVLVLNQNRLETFKESVNSNLAAQRAESSSVAEMKNCSNYNLNKILCAFRNRK